MRANGVLLSTIVLLGFPLPTVSQANDTGEADVEGIVQDVTTGTPIAGAAVRIRGTSHGTTTDDHGRFVLRGVAAGVEHVWVIESLGYVTWEQPLVVTHMDHLKIGLMARPFALERIRVTVDRLEARRRLATVAVHSMGVERLGASTASEAAGLVRSLTPWPARGCPPNPRDPEGLGLCVYYRGGVQEIPVCLDDRPAMMVELFAYGAAEIHSIDFVGGPRPHVRVYTRYFLERAKPLRPLAWGCSR